MYYRHMFEENSLYTGGVAQAKFSNQLHTLNLCSTKLNIKVNKLYLSLCDKSSILIYKLKTHKKLLEFLHDNT